MLQKRADNALPAQQAIRPQAAENYIQSSVLELFAKHWAAKDSITAGMSIIIYKVTHMQ